MANNLIEPSLEEAKARIAEIVLTMSELELEKFRVGLEEWRESTPSKREHAREDLSIYALFMLGTYFFKDYITNISAGGLFLETKTPVDVGGKVFISFALPDNEDTTEVEGKIVRVKSNGFGVKFKEPLSELADKREHFREHTSIYALFKSNGLSFKDSIKNLSAGGLFIESGIPISVNRKLSISFLHPNSETLIKVAGEIVRTDSNGIGVKFDQPRRELAVR